MKGRVKENPSYYVNRSSITKKEMPARGKALPCSGRKPQGCNSMTPELWAPRISTKENARRQD